MVCLAAGLIASTGAVTAGRAVAADSGNSAKDTGATAPAETPETLAVAEAKRTGKPVDVPALRTELSDVVAQPDGRLKATVFTQPQRVRQGGRWADIDATLQVAADGSVAPRAVTADVRFSGGGSQPLVRIARAGKELRLTWPERLPRPVVSDDTAEYRSILPDVDLRLTATRTGFTQVIVVHTAQAAKNPKLDVLRLGMKGDGLVVKEAADGSLTAVDKAGGGTVFEAPAPVMWDSGRTAPAAQASPTTAPTAGKSAKSAPAAESSAKSTPAADVPEGAAAGTPAKSEAAAPSGAVQAPLPGAKLAKLAVDFPAAQDALVLTPDRRMLDAPDTVFPVMIDPAWNTPQAADWAGVSRTFPDQAYWHYTYTSTPVNDFGVGYCGDTSRCAPLDVKRIFFQVPTAQFVGKQILTATFGAWENHSYSCTKKPVELWGTGYISKSTTWNSQNAANFWSRKLQAVDAANGYNGCGDGAWVEFGSGAANPSDAVKNLVQDGANWNWPTTTFGLRATNESDTYAWKRFTSAYLQVYYNVPPRQSAMSDLTMSPGGSCLSTITSVNKWPQIAAKATDPDGDAIGVQFAVDWSDGTTYKRRWWSTGDEATPPASNTFKASGSVFSLQLPSFTTSASGNYGWEMRAWDGAQWGPWSSNGDPTSCLFNVDTAIPSGPTVTSASYPVSTDVTAPLPWTDGVGRYGAFTLKAATTNIVAYQWGLDAPASADHQIATTSGAAQTVNVLPETPGPHTLTVKSINAAGTASQPETYYFNVRNGQGRRTGWAMDETGGAASLAATGFRSDATLGSSAVAGSPGHLGQAVTLNDNAATGYAETTAAVLDTSKSFTVSAWVRYDGGQGHYSASAVSQNGPNYYAYTLGVENVGGASHWSFKIQTKPGDQDATTVVAASPGVAAVGQWTHLTGTYNQTGGFIQLSVNGQWAASSGVASGWDGHGPMEIGRTRWNGQWVDPWAGAVDEIRLWDRSLDAGEITKIAADQGLATGRPAKAVFHLDEASGATQVSGAAEVDALALSGDAGTGAAGIAGNAVHFNGATGYGKTDRPQIDGTRSFTVSAWVKSPKMADTDTNVRMALSQSGVHSDEFILYYSGYWKRWIFGRYKEDSDTDTLVRTMQADCTPGSTVNGVPCFSGLDNQWTHLVGVSDATAKKLRLYINGYLVGESDYTQTTPWPTPGALRVGAVQHNGVYSQFFNGDIDDVHVFDRVVTKPEIADLVIAKPQLAGRWKLNTTTGNPLATPDESPAAAHALIAASGATTAPDTGLLMDGVLNLDGVAGYAESTTTPLHTDRSFTLAAWANTAGLPTRDMAVLSAPGTTGAAVTLSWHYVKTDPDTQQVVGEWRAAVADKDAATATVTVVSNSPSPIYENWTHLAVVYDGLSGRLSLFVNGESDRTGCTGSDLNCLGRSTALLPGRPFDSAAPAAGTSRVDFGRTKAAGAWRDQFSGQLDDVWAYQGVLTQDQITRLADYGTVIDTTTGP
ncbi:LamG-like jellyroll fold domain-containing protein [Kitasatospora sp. NPDC093679]|uniref:LamG-like jellyroll fold domain-containing protein n=1 Tax=Kitasatospora sp. NPDC093679 TaxID=3154983 RepID=UPI003424930A